MLLIIEYFVISKAAKFYDPVYIEDYKETVKIPLNPQSDDVVIQVEPEQKKSVPKEESDKILNEALSFLGINNINVEKKERLVEDEANANNEYINLNLMSRLIPRKEACKKFNELFNPDEKIDVRLRSDLQNIIKKVDSIVDDFIDKQLEEKVSDEYE